MRLNKRSEDENVDVFINHLEKKGYRCSKEVVPDQCKNWTHPWAVDIVVETPDGEKWGVEAKNFKSLGQGSKVGKGFKQIEKYSSCTFNGVKINKWFFLVTKKYGTYMTYRDQEIIEFLRFFSRSYNISIIELGRTSRKDFIRYDDGTPGWKTFFNFFGD